MNNQISNQRAHTKTMVFMGLMMALAMVGTFMIRIPIPATQGYIHIGDSVLILSVFALGWKKGAVAGAVGEALADLLAGYAIFAPITLVVKIMMGALIGIAIKTYMENAHHQSPLKKYAMPSLLYILSGLAMIGGYYLAESVMYGSVVVPLVEIPANAIQFVGGSAIAFACMALLYKTPIRRYFTYLEKS